MKFFLGILIIGGAFWLFLFLFNGGKSDIYVSRAIVQQTPGLPITPPHLPLYKGRTGGVNDRADARVPLVATRGTLATADGTVLVTRVVDGDTIEIDGGEKVRYIGVNTPESVDPRRKVQCFGKEASAYNKKMVLGKRVRLEPDIEDRDKYGRLLRYVWLGDTMVNEQLVSDGYAQVMTIPPNVKYVDRFKAAQTEAREARRGLWEKCRK